jgi:hypothetical protein
MFKKLTYGLLFLLILTTLTCHKENPTSPPAEEIPATMPQTDIPWPSLANSPWPMAYHDPQLTGRSPFKGPQSGKLDWKANPFDYGTTSGISIGVDGTIYYMCFKHLIALNPDGTEKWRFECGYNPDPTPLIGADNTIYLPSSEGYFYAIHPDGTLKWKCSVGQKMPGSANIGLDGTLYVVAEGDSTLYAISYAGTILWRYYEGKGFQSHCPAISPDGTTIYLPGIDKFLYAVTTTGQFKWKVNMEGRFWAGPVIDNQGNLYISPRAKPSHIVSISPIGNIRWIHEYGPSDMEASGVTLDHNGQIYLVDDGGGQILGLDYAGQRRWVWKYPESLGVWSALVCDIENTVYFCTSNPQYAVVALTEAGKQKWAVTFDFLPGLPEYCPAIGNNERFYRNGAISSRWIYCIK